MAAVGVMSSQALTVGSQVEERLRRNSLTGRIRFSEFFKDFDPLKSGVITNSQFRRCLDQHLTVKLNEADHAFLASKYSDREKYTVNYKAFCKAMEDGFDPSVLDGSPEQQIEAFQKSTVPSLPPSLSPDALNLTDKILQKCQEYYKHHGINIKSCYCDFDKHHRGLVTQSQFSRGFPGPPDIAASELVTLVQRYCDPTTGLCSYIQFHNDLMLAGTEEVRGTSTTTQAISMAASKRSQVCDLDEILGRIRDAVYMYGIRTTEFFRDHDKLRSGVITRNQFVCGLSLCCGQRAHLSREDIQRVAEHYCNRDGRICYKEFCDVMENAYNEPELEKKPTASTVRPLEGHLTTGPNVLGSEAEEEQVKVILTKLKGEVSRRGLLLYPYFRDYDRHNGYTKGVTKPQFERLLSFLSLSLNPEEMKLIVGKFEDAATGDVKYVDFIQAVDEQHTGQTKDMERDRKESHAQSSPPPPLPPPPPLVDLSLLLCQIREYVTVYQIRGSEFFQDFDPLRSGSIPASRFRQGLSLLGQSSLTDAQFIQLCEHYADHKQKRNVLWKKFISDTEHGFAEATLPCTTDFDATAEAEEKESLEMAIRRLREKIRQRRILTKPCFQDFDRHHIGYVTHSQFRQCLAYLGLEATEHELTLMDQRFGDSKGVNYMEFLKQVQPSGSLENKYERRMMQISTRRAMESGEVAESSSVDAGSVMGKIKTKVVKERIRVLEFMKDYDKLRSGRIPVTSFHRALDLCGFGLSQAEVSALEKRYQTPKDHSFVDYIQFSDEVESIFTQNNLEKMPTAEVQQFTPPRKVTQNVLSPEEEEITINTMHRLAESVRVKQILMLPQFADYDRVHIGSVTRSQFHRVLNGLNMGSLFSAAEFNLLCSKFNVQVGLGGRGDVHYITFCQMIDDHVQKC